MIHNWAQKDELLGSMAEDKPFINPCCCSNSLENYCKEINDQETLWINIQRTHYTKKYQIRMLKFKKPCSISLLILFILMTLVILCKSYYFLYFVDKKWKLERFHNLCSLATKFLSNSSSIAQSAVWLVYHLLTIRPS